MNLSLKTLDDVSVAPNETRCCFQASAIAGGSAGAPIKSIRPISGGWCARIERRATLDGAFSQRSTPILRGAFEILLTIGTRQASAGAAVLSNSAPVIRVRLPTFVRLIAPWANSL